MYQLLTLAPDRHLALGHYLVSAHHPPPARCPAPLAIQNLPTIDTASAHASAYRPAPEELTPNLWREQVEAFQEEFQNRTNCTPASEHVVLLTSN